MKKLGPDFRSWLLNERRVASIAVAHLRNEREGQQWLQEWTVLEGHVRRRVLDWYRSVVVSTGGICHVFFGVRLLAEGLTLSLPGQARVSDRAISLAGLAPGDVLEVTDSFRF